MTDAYRDENGVPAIIAASKNDGTTIVRVLANPTTHGLTVDDNATGSDNGNNSGLAMRDGNFVPVFIAVSSADGFTPVEVYADPVTGSLLVNSN